MTWDEYEELAKKMTSGEGSSKVYGTHNHTCRPWFPTGLYRMGRIPL